MHTSTMTLYFDFGLACQVMLIVSNDDLEPTVLQNRQPFCLLYKCSYDLQIEFKNLDTSCLVKLAKIPSAV
jgi:hypothetical protein